MKRTVFYLMLLVLMALIVHIECKFRKPSKHSRHGPGGRSPHHHHHHHHDGRSKHGHGHHGHGHDHHHGVHDYGYDHGHGDGYYDHHSLRKDWGAAGSAGSSHYEAGYRHRRDIIINGTNEMNETVPSTSSPGWCSKVVSVTTTFAQSFQKSRKVPAIVKCGWLHLAKCKVYRIGYELVYRQATRVVYAKIKKCCPGFMEINGICEPIGGRTTPPAPTTTEMQPTTPDMTATTTAMMTTTDGIPDDYMEVMDDKIQKLVSAIIVLLLLIVTVASIVGCVIYMCKLCHKHKQARYV
ncbi:uncharacterized protein [Diadema antillarum]|uniref:uncharacterized protein n=1 Tax=Diadema antillarum TaxID=105358 RepID=UPI003A84282F